MSEPTRVRVCLTMRHSPTETISRFAARLRRGRSASFGNLKIVPLFSTPTGTTALGLETALRRRLVTISEVDRAGDVGTVIVRNTSADPILILDGEELVGAKQNRIVNTSTLVPPKSSIGIPVSCVERGRWQWKTRSFACGSVLPSSMRRAKTTRVTQTLRHTGVFDADQLAVWREVADYAAHHAVESPTGALSEVLERTRHSVQHYVEALPRQPRQSGLAGYIGGRLVAVDVVGRPDLYESLHGRLVAALAAEAIHVPPAGRRCSSRGLSLVLSEVLTSGAHTATPPGLGVDVRYESDNYIGAGLVCDGAVVHFAVVPKQ